MSRKSNKFIFKHQYKPAFRTIGPETLTVPDLVLSMRDVYQKYVMFGSVEGLAVSPLVQDDRLMDDFPDETVDTLLLSSQIREQALEELKRKTEEKPEEKPEDKPEDKPEEEPRDIPKD